MTTAKELAYSILNEYRIVAVAAAHGGGEAEAFDAIDRLADLARMVVREEVLD